MLCKNETGVCLQNIITMLINSHNTLNFNGYYIIIKLIIMLEVQNDF